jgi:phosphate:Na+ symporter
VRRAALAHIVYNVSIGVLGILLLRPITAAAGWVGSRLDDYNGVLSLAAFSSIFKLVGVAAFYPWLDGFSRFIVRISGRGTDSAVSRLDPVLAEAGGTIALEAAWRATLELAHGSIDAVRLRLTGESVHYEPPVEAVQRTDHFLESLSLETADLSTIEPRLVRLCHAVDHLIQLHDDLTRLPSAADGWQRPPGFDAGARALAAWLDATKDPKAASNRAILKALEDTSKQLSAERKTDRDRMLEAVALQRMPIATARAGLETLAWADGALYHAWRLAEALRTAAGNPTAASFNGEDR